MPLVRVERRGRCAWVTLDRPPLNLFTLELIAAVRETFDTLARDAGVGAAVGPGVCAAGCPGGAGGPLSAAGGAVRGARPPAITPPPPGSAQRPPPSPPAGGARRGGPSAPVGAAAGAGGGPGLGGAICK